jgi:hypothetical protein
MLNRVALSERMLPFGDDILEKIYFSDESRVVLRIDRQWVWYRRGERNPSAFVTTRKFPPSVMIFAVIGIGYKSQLLIVSGSINADKHTENCMEVNFIHDLDDLHGRWNWMYQQDGQPVI